MDSLTFDPRVFKSPCCNARVQEVLKTMNTRSGLQLVYRCIACDKLHVIGEEGK